MTSSIYIYNNNDYEDDYSIKKNAELHTMTYLSLHGHTGQQAPGW